MADDPFQKNEKTNQRAALLSRLEQVEVAAGFSGVRLMPVAHDRFQARWALSEDGLERGRAATAVTEGEADLILRVFFLPRDAAAQELSADWQEYSISGPLGSGYFDLPKPAERINASVGLRDRTGRFYPLERGQAIGLPASPVQRAKAAPESAAAEPTPRHEPPPAPAPKARPVPEPLDETGIEARLEALSGLPETLRLPPASGPASDEAPTPRLTPDGPGESRAINSLDETAVLSRVRERLALDPEPEMTLADRPDEGTGKGANADSSAVVTATTSGASELLASQWEDLWSAQAPIEIRATFVLSGRLAPDMRLLLGHEIVRTDPGGSFTWERELRSFDQVWPLLRAAITPPTVPAEPALSFYREGGAGQRLLDLDAAVRIEGRLQDASYATRLPDGLSVDDSGAFRLTRLLPAGGVILPGLSLVAC